MVRGHPRPVVPRKGVQMRFHVLPTLLCAALALSVVPAASPGPANSKHEAATRVVTFTLSDRGKGRWSTSGDSDRGSMAMNYTWKGTAKFRIPTAALARAATATFNVLGTATLRGSWVGDYVGTQTGTPISGPYHCTYKGTNVRIQAGAQLKKARKKGKVQLVLFSQGLPYAAAGFFPTKGTGTAQSCATSIGSQGPPHFQPEALFREAFNDRGQLTNRTAMIDMPATVLPRSSVKVVFPRENGTIDSPDRPKLSWHNVGSLTARAS
jgi:hypothetical protein